MATRRSIRLCLLAVALASCGGASSTETSNSCYASWTCAGPQCASVMGGTSGTAGPFPDASTCEAWRQTYILSSSCSCGGAGGAGGSGSPPSVTGVSPTAGAPGASVTVTGTGFPGTSSGVTVSLCGVSATLTSVSNTQIVFTVPSMTTSSCAVILVTPSGTVTSGTTFSVLPGPVALAQGGSGWGIAVDATAVYWTETGGEVKTVGLGGGAVTTLATGLTNPQAIAVDATSVYFADNSVSGTLQKVPLNGGTAVTLASGLFQVTAIAVDATSVYWVENNQPGAVKMVGLAGGSVTTLASNLYAPIGIAVDANAVYWTESNGAVRKAPLMIAAGGTRVVTTIATGVGAGLLALDATNVYFPSGTGVARVGKNGGIASVLASGQPNAAYGIAVDASNVYWVEQSTMASIQDGAVKKVSLASSAVTTITTLASGLAFPKCIAVDGSSVYWTENAGMSPKKISK